MRSRMLFLSVCLFSALAFAQGTCSGFNYTVGPLPYIGPSDTIDHLSGYHRLQALDSATCSYSGTGPCTGVANTYSVPNTAETQGLATPWVHEAASSFADGRASATFPSAASASATSVGAVTRCVVGCFFTISISTPGGPISFSSTPRWQQSHNYSNTCTPFTTKVQCGGKNQPSCPICDNGCGPSPILIDTKNEGWHLTDPNTANGYVTFNFGGKLMKVSFPDPNFDNAWLVYDKNGVIDGADDLFGNFTDHSDCGMKGNKFANGFCAADWYDQPEQGGNGDQVLDKQDAIWSKLRLWKPKHCFKTPDEPCVALDSELFTLESQGMTRLSMAYQGSAETDAVGNQCRFKAMVNPDPGEAQKSHDGRWACDFNLAIRKQ